jgi:hypothetical protein
MSMLGVNGRWRTASYLVISFAWTWALWLGGWMLGQARQTPIDTGGTVTQTLCEPESSKHGLLDWARFP